MKLTVSALPVAVLALGSIGQAPAASLCAASYTMTQVTTAGFSCTLGDLTFSAFAAAYSAAGPGASTPDLDTITVVIAEAMSGSDPFGTVAIVSSPIYSVMANYSVDNSVVESQSETGLVQYLVTDGLGGTSITEVDAAITGMAANTAVGALDKSLCPNNGFFEIGPTPTSLCFAGSSITAASGLSLTTPAGTQADGTPDFSDSFALSILGVFDGWNLDGGSSDPTAAADVTSVENDFIETFGISSISPEPATAALVGGALVGFGILRRRRKLA